MKKKSLSIKPTIRVNSDTLLMISFVLFFSYDLWATAACVVFRFVGLSSVYAYSATRILIYLPVVLYVFLTKKIVAPEFIVLLALLVVSFLITIIIHPDYEFWYTRDTYGVWDYVLRPDNGIYVFFFIIAIKDSEKLWRYLRIAAFFALLYYTYRFIPFLKNGYWEITSYKTGEVRKWSYNLEYGYDVLLHALIYLYCALKSKKVFDWIMAVLGVSLVVFGGSRGAVLCIAIFLALYFLCSLETAKNRLIKIFVVAVIGAGLVFSYKYIIELAEMILAKVGVSSRFLSALVSGTVADNNGRYAIWNATLDMIKSNPFGYGIMGTRHVLHVLHIAAYPHNLFLELIADYGVFLRGGLCIFLLVKTVSILRMKNIEQWKGLFLVFLGQTCQLLLSGTIYHRNGFWGALAIGVCIYGLRNHSYAKDLIDNELPASYGKEYIRE